MELTDNDKQRIKEAFSKEFPYSSGHGMDFFFSGYESATIYERQELRNKVIGEVTEVLRQHVEFGQLEVSWFIVEEKLNSFKTK